MSERDDADWRGVDPVNEVSSKLCGIHRLTRPLETLIEVNNGTRNSKVQVYEALPNCEYE